MYDDAEIRRLASDFSGLGPASVVERMRWHGKGRELSTQTGASLACGLQPFGILGGAGSNASPWGQPDKKGGCPSSQYFAQPLFLSAEAPLWQFS